VRTILLSMICASTLSLSASVDVSLTFDDPVVRSLFADLLRLGGYGYVNTERAAFLIREANGDYRCALWTMTGRWKRERFSGVVPAGTVAVVHTHPNRTPLGSPSDRRTSLVLKVPVFILTRENVYVITGDGANVALVQARVWATALSGEDRCR